MNVPAKSSERATPYFLTRGKRGRLSGFARYGLPDAAMPAYEAGIRLAMRGYFALLNTPRIMIRQRALEMSALTAVISHCSIHRAS